MAYDLWPMAYGLRWPMTYGPVADDLWRMAYDGV